MKEHNPLSQFEIKKLYDLSLGGYDVSFTNSSLFMLIAVTLSTIFFMIAVAKNSLIPGRIQYCAEFCYKFIASMVRENVGSAGMKYLPLVFGVFIFVLMCNLLGMLPYSFTVTSHIIVTFALAMIVFLTVVVVGLARHGLHFFSLFLPKGTPWWMAPLMFFIEFVAFLARPISLSVRLGANMIAGHTMLAVIGGFVTVLGFAGGWLPVGFLTILIGFEIFVAILQAYIFAVLTCVYLNDAVNLH